MTTNDKGFTKSVRGARIDELCAGHTKAPDYAANVRAAQQAVADRLIQARSYPGYAYIVVNDFQLEGYDDKEIQLTTRAQP